MKLPLALAILQLLVRKSDRDEVLGDLVEGFSRRRERNGRTVASFWLWRQAVSVPLRLVADRLSAGGRCDVEGERADHECRSGKADEGRGLVAEIVGPEVRENENNVAGDHEHDRLDAQQTFSLRPGRPAQGQEGRARGIP